MRPHRAIHLPLHIHLVTALLWLAACRVEGYYYYPDSGDAYIPNDDWVVRLGGADNEGIGMGTAIAAAPDGDLVLVGSFQGTTNLGGSPITYAGDLPFDDIWVARYRPDGSHVWSIGLGGPSGDAVNAVAVDSAGDVYVAGGFAGTVDFGGGGRAGGGGAGFVVKLAGTNGAYTWDRTFPAGAGGITVLDSTVIVIASMREAPTLALVALDSATGADRWSRSLNSADPLTGQPARCNVIGVGGDVIAAGTFLGTIGLGGGSLTSLGQSDVFIARFRGSDGAHIWSRRYGGTNLDNAYALATDGERIFLGGSFVGTANFGRSELMAAGVRDAFVASYDAVNGAPLWSQRFGGASTTSSDDETTSIAANSSQLSITLGFGEAITIGDQTFSSYSGGFNYTPDTAIARLDPASGQPFDTWHFQSAGANRMAVTCTGRALAGSGAFAQTTYLFGTPLTSLGQGDLAVFRFELDRGKP